MTATDAYLASAKAIDDLKAINARFIENFINNDVAAHDALLHPRFIAIRSDGTRVGRADYLKAWASGFDPGFIVYWDVRDELITLVGNVALVRAANKHVLRHPGHDEMGMTSTPTPMSTREARGAASRRRSRPSRPARSPATRR